MLNVINDTDTSSSVSIELSLTSPDGDRQAFYSSSIFAYSQQTTSEVIRVTPAQWFGATGAYSVVASTDSDPDAASLNLMVNEPEVIVPTFEDVTDDEGVGVEQPAPECGQFSNGAAWSDLDGDNDPDLVVTALAEPVRIFMNNGVGGFADVTASSGVAVDEANSVSAADFDGDGDDDLLLVGDGSDTLFANDGSGHFTDVSEHAGIGDDGQRGMGAAWADFDLDGDLDVYIVNYMHCTGDWSTAEEVVAQVAYDEDVLYRNNGDGTFSRATDLLEHDPTAPHRVREQQLERARLLLARRRAGAERHDGGAWGRQRGKRNVSRKIRECSLHRMRRIKSIDRTLLRLEIVEREITAEVECKECGDECDDRDQCQQLAAVHGVSFDEFRRPVPVRRR